MNDSNNALTTQPLTLNNRRNSEWLIQINKTLLGADTVDQSQIYRQETEAYYMVDMKNVSKFQQRLALFSTTIAFTICFAVWTIFAIIGVQIKKDMGLNDTQFSLLIGTPILTGSIIRLTLGIWADQYGGRPILLMVMLSSAVCTWLLIYADTYEMLLVTALGVGIAGGSFVVGISYISKWFSKEHQGTALGIYGMGNIGAAVTKFTAPFIMVAYGWRIGSASLGRNLVCYGDSLLADNQR